MRIFPPKIEITDNEGFDDKKDIFGRAQFGQGLANLFCISEDPLVVALDGPWGSGKSTFVKMLAGHLRQKGHPVIYFDAFANDYIDDAFLAIAGQVIALAQDTKAASTPAHEKFIKKAIKVGRVFIQSGAKIGVKAATLGALNAADIDELKSVTQDIASVTSGKADEYIESLLSHQREQAQDIEAFKQALTEVADTLAKVDQKADSPAPAPASLIFIIDELDRCKPTFALEILEKIKHVFSTCLVHFLLVGHFSQLENSVRFSYGPDIDARTYLDKFYNLIVHLPEGSSDHTRSCRKFLTYLKKHLRHDEDSFNFVENVANAKNLTLRTIERITSYISLSIAFTTSKKSTYFRPPPILAGLCVLKATNPSLFQKAKYNQLKLNDALQAFGIPEWEDEHAKAWVTQWWTFALKEDIDLRSDEWSSFGRGMWQYSIDRTDIVRLVANQVVDRMNIPQD
jgi:energy-coupling factor transporter ATP-binding protein EcfA2